MWYASRLLQLVLLTARVSTCPAPIPKPQQSPKQRWRSLASRRRWLSRRNRPGTRPNVDVTPTLHCRWCVRHTDRGIASDIDDDGCCHDYNHRVTRTHASQCHRRDTQRHRITRWHMYRQLRSPYRHSSCSARTRLHSSATPPFRRLSCCCPCQSIAHRHGGAPSHHSSHAQHISQHPSYHRHHSSTWRPLRA